MGKVNYMKNIGWIALACLMCSQISWGQVTKADSLRAKLKTDIQDTSRIDLLIELGDELILKSYYESIEYYYQSKALALKLKDTARIVYSLVGITDVHSMLGEYKEALSILNEAIALSSNNIELLATTHSRLAIEYFHIGDYDLSIKNDRISLQYNKQLNDSLQIAYDIHNIGTYYLAIGKIDSAIINYKLSNTYLGDKKDILRAYNNSRMGFSHSNSEQYKEAIKYHHLALDIYAKDSLIYDMAFEENYIASAYFNGHQLDKSLKHAFKAIELTKQLNNHLLFVQNYHLLFDIFNKQKDYKTALKYALLEKVYSDSLEAKNKENIINTMETKNQYTEQQKVLEAIERSNTELSSQKTKLVIFGIITASLLVITIIMLILKRKEHDKNKQLLHQLDSISQTRNKLLSIIGHDLRGSLGNLKNFTELMHHKLLDKGSIEYMLSQFVPMVDSTHSLLETLLLWSHGNDEDFSLQKEKINAAKLIETTVQHLSHLAEVKSIDIKYDKDELEFMADQNMILTIMRNLVSNAIKFSNKNSSIFIHYKSSDKFVAFEVEDEGIGMSVEEIARVLSKDEHFINEGTTGEKGAGIGLNLCNSFISKHGGDLLIQSEPGKGSKFKFVIPI